ncbi:MAG: ABC transporter ATP-binding protein [Nitrososphaerota archaeon]|nr:ABC transporter ATP-binding protein [Nitrososphaerota archaeon]
MKEDGGKAVIVRSLVKRFGNLTAVDGISFEINYGEIFGLIGPNGAGKTTTLRIIATLLMPTSGNVKVFGYDIVKDASEIRKLISYLAEDVGTYRNINGKEYLSIIAKIYFDSKDEASKAVEEAIKLSGLGNRVNDAMKTYSKGMKRRIQIARVLMTRPKLAILDEPTSGLDVFHAQYIRSIIKKYAENGGTVILSSHNMLEVEYLCSRVALMHQGHIVIQDEPQAINSKFGTSNLEDAFIKVVSS